MTTDFGVSFVRYRMSVTLMTTTLAGEVIGISTVLSMAGNPLTRGTMTFSKADPGKTKVDLSMEIVAA